jgi:hypothetical protein
VSPSPITPNHLSTSLTFNEFLQTNTHLTHTNIQTRARASAHVHAYILTLCNTRHETASVYPRDRKEPPRSTRLRLSFLYLSYCDFSCATRGKKREREKEEPNVIFSFFLSFSFFSFFLYAIARRKTKKGRNDVYIRINRCRCRFDVVDDDDYTRFSCAEKKRCVESTSD